MFHPHKKTHWIQIKTYDNLSILFLLNHLDPLKNIITETHESKKQIIFQMQRIQELNNKIIKP